jgi:hypothetical protein
MEHSGRGDAEHGEVDHPAEPRPMMQFYLLQVSRVRRSCAPKAWIRSSCSDGHENIVQQPRKTTKLAALAGNASPFTGRRPGELAKPPREVAGAGKAVTVGDRGDGHLIWIEVDELVAGSLRPSSTSQPKTRIVIR